MADEGVFHGSPAGVLVGKQIADLAGETFRGGGEASSTDGFKEGEISFLLAGNEVVDDHGAVGGDGFVDGGTAGLADDEVVAGEELRDFAGPADEADAAGVGEAEFVGAAIEAADIAAHNDGEVDPGRGVEQGTAVFLEEPEICGGEIEHAEGIARIHGIDGLEPGEGGMDGEAGIDDFFRRKLAADHLGGGGGIGDEPPISGSFEPGGVDLDGIGDDGENRNFPPDALGDAAEEIRVKRVGADDGVRVEFVDQGAEGTFREAHDGGGAFAEIAAIGGIINAFPDAGETGGDDAVGAADDGGDAGGTEQAGVGDAGDGACGIECEPEIAGGTVVALAEGGGDDEDARWGLHDGCGGRFRGRRALRRWSFASFLSSGMAREDKPLRLRTVDDETAEVVPVVRLENRETEARERDVRPVRLGAAEADLEVPSRRLDLPSREEIELRTHQPGIELLIEPEVANPDLVEENWGEATVRRNPIPWGWFALIGLTITGAVIWSLTRVEKADEQLNLIRETTQSVLVDEEKEEREATQLVDRLERQLRAYFNVTTVEALAGIVRHRDRVEPLLRDYYKDKPVFSAKLKSIKVMQPLTLDNRGNFWMASVILENGMTRNMIIEIDEDGRPLMDWETLVCHQPMSWDEFVTRRPTGTSMDFRVYVERDSFYSHEFADSDQWTSFRLTALDSEETLFGYAHAGSDESKAIEQLIRQNPAGRATLILRLSIPEGLASRRGAVIEKLINSRWLFVEPPDTGS